MLKRHVFYSFHFDNDVMRVQQIRNFGAIEGNVPVSANQWERIRRKGDYSIRNWINENMRNRSCVIVLVGEETAYRKWVKYEISQAWKTGKGLLGIYIHNIRCPRRGKCRKGPNPFDQFKFEDGTRLSNQIKCYDPSSLDTYNDIRRNLEIWIGDAIKSAKRR